MHPPTLCWCAQPAYKILVSNTGRCEFSGFRAGCIRDAHGCQRRLRCSSVGVTMVIQVKILPQSLYRFLQNLKNKQNGPGFF